LRHPSSEAGMECRTGRETPDGTRRALLEELKGLFGPAFGPALAA
jgi:hypothetical protein